MRTVWKYVLELKEGPQSRMIPYLSNVLLGPHIAIQDGKITLWAEVDTEEVPTEYVFYVFGTGWEIKNNVDYMGSVLMNDGSYVWHVFVEQEHSE